jgi:hypothetical protein
MLFNVADKNNSQGSEASWCTLIRCSANIIDKMRLSQFCCLDHVFTMCSLYIGLTDALCG